MTTIQNIKKVQLEGCYDYENITPNDSADLRGLTRGILLEEDGALAIQNPANNESVTIPNLAGGIIHPIQTKRILATGTDASAVFVSY